MKRWAKGISKIEVIDKLPKHSPAAVNKYTGVMYVTRQYWDSLPADYRAFIYQHENAHLTAQTKDELRADQIAFEAYAKSGKSLKNAVNVLADTLDPKGNPEHYARLYNQTVRALAYDRRISFTEAEKLLKQKTITMNTLNFNGQVNGKIAAQYHPHRIYRLSQNSGFDRDHELFLGKVGNWIKETSNKVSNTGLVRGLQDVSKGVLGAATMGLTNNLIQTQNDKDKAAKQAAAAAEQQKAAELAQEMALVQKQQEQSLLAQQEASKDTARKAGDDARQKKMYWIMGGGAAFILVVIVAVVLLKK